MTIDAKRTLAAWENNGQVFYAALDPSSSQRPAPIAAPGETGNRKHPAIASNARGETIMVWTEGTGWQKGGLIAWQVYDRDGKTTEVKGAAASVPVWGLATVVAEADGSFSIFY